MTSSERSDTNGALRTAGYVFMATLGPIVTVGLLGGAGVSVFHNQDYGWAIGESLGAIGSGYVSYRGIRGIRRELALAKK